MRNTGSLAAAAALLVVLWLVWSRLRIVVFVAVPWWGLLLGALALFLVLQHLFARLLGRR